MSTHTDELAALRAEITELRARLDDPGRSLRPRMPRRLTRRLVLLALAVALVLPAGGALASHQFSDVPSSYQFHNSIDAIADAGITTGCGGGKYCPNGLVTRGQMAAFLSRLGALIPGSDPKVNADKLDGLHASAFVRPLYAVVQADGSLDYGVGVVSTEKVNVGRYTVTFNRNIRLCAASVTVGNLSETGSPNNLAGAAKQPLVNNGQVVLVNIFNGNGVFTDEDFMLNVTCGPVFIGPVIPFGTEDGQSD